MIKFIFLFIVFIIIILFAWRLLSTRYILPCPSWLGWMVELDNPFSKINRAATIIENSDLKPGMSVIDIGCGPGRLTIPLAKKVGPTGKVLAMDIQTAMLDKVKNKSIAANLTNINFLHGGIGDGKLEQNEFDRAMLVTVLGEIPNQEKALKEIYNGLKGNGTLSVTEIIFDTHFQRQSTILKLAKATGFKMKNKFGNSIAFTIILEKTTL